MKSKSPKKLNSRTPQWFRDWHSQEFVPVVLATMVNKRFMALVSAITVAILIKVLLG